MPTLEVLTGVNSRRLYDLSTEQTVVGRYEFCDVVLPSHTVSRQHARIVHAAEGFFIEDLDSRNGTFVNQQRVEGRRSLTDGDIIHIYDIRMVFHMGEIRPVDIAELADTNDETSITKAGGPTVRSPSAPEHVAPVAAANNELDQTDPATGSQSRLRAALKISLQLEGSQDVDEILPRILDSLFEIFPQSIRGYVLMAEEPGNFLVPRAIKHAPSEAGASMTFGPISRQIATRVMSLGRPLLLCDDDDGRAAERRQSVLDEKLLSIICAPLMGPSKIPLGIIYLDANDPVCRFEHDDLDVLVAVATIAGQAVETAQQELSLPTPRQGHEMGLARQVQMQFLPQQRPVLNGYCFFDFYQPAEEVGGDYFGYIPLPDGRLALAIGDVAGKGVSAALLMAHFCAEVRYCLLNLATPSEVVSRLNQDLAAETLNYHFVTFVLCVLDPVKHTLTVVNAGHMPPLLRRSAGRSVEELGMSQGGLPLGCEVDHAYEQTQVELRPGDTVVLYTDGISEAMSPAGEVYRASRLRDLLRRGPEDVDTLGTVLLADVRRFAGGRLQSDDICLVCFARE